MGLFSFFKGKEQRRNDEYFSRLSGEQQPYRDAYEAVHEIKKATPERLLEIEKELHDRLRANFYTAVDLKQEADIAVRFSKSINENKIKLRYKNIIDKIAQLGFDLHEKLIEKYPDPNQPLPPSFPGYDSSDEIEAVSDEDIEIISDNKDTSVDMPAVLDLPPELPPQLPADTADTYLDSPLDNGRENEPKNPKEILESLQGIARYNEASQILSFEDQSLPPVDMGGVPNNLELKSPLLVEQYNNGNHISFCYGAPGEFKKKAMFVIDFNNKNEITRIEGYPVSLELNFAPIIVTENPLANFAKTFQKFCNALESKTKPALEPNPILPPEPLTPNVPAAAAAPETAPLAPPETPPLTPPETAPLAPPAPEKKTLDFQMRNKDNGTFQYRGGEAQLAIPGFAISDYKVEPNGNMIVAFRAKPDNHRPEYVRAVLEPTPDETKDRLIKKISLYKITPDTHGGHHDKKELIESSVDKAIKNAGVLTETFEVIGSLVNFNDVYPRLKHGHGDHGHGHGDHGHDDGKGPTSGLNTPGSKDKPKPAEAHKPKEEEKSKAPETVGSKELQVFNGIIYYEGKKVDFSIKGFKFYGVSGVFNKSNELVGQNIRFKPEKSVDEKYLVIYLQINKETKKIAGIALDKHIGTESSQIHWQATPISTNEELTTVLGSLARLVERTNPLGLPEEKADKKDSAHGGAHEKGRGGGGHGHDHGKPSPKAPKLRTEQHWKENKFGSEPVLNIDSDLFYLLMKQENVSGKDDGVSDNSGLTLGKEMSTVYRMLIKGDERAAERRFKEMFDAFGDAEELQKKIDDLSKQNPQPEDFEYRMDRLKMLQKTVPKFIETLAENRTTLADFKAEWNKENGLWKDVYEVIQKATAADRAVELAARVDSMEAVSGQMVKGYAKKALARGGVLLAGGIVGHYVGDALYFDALGKEFMAGARAGGAAAAHRLGTNRWGAVADYIKNVGEGDIQAYGKEVDKKRLDGLVQDMENDADFHDYKMRSMSKWLSQGLRNATVKRAKEHANLEAGLDKNDDPNLYLMKIKAAEALRHEYREQGELGKARLAELDKYVNSLNQKRFTAKLNFEDRGKKKFEKDAGKVHSEVKTSAGGKNDGKGIFQLANEKLNSGYLWARSADKKLRNKGDMISIGLGIALGVAVSPTLSPLRRTIMTLSGVTVGGEIGAHLDAQATVKKINKEIEKTMHDVKKLVDGLKSKRINGAPNRPDTENFGAVKKGTGFFEKRKMKRASKKVEALRPEMDSLKEPVNDGDDNKFNQETKEYNSARENQLSEKIIDLEVALLSGKLNPALELEVQDVILSARETSYFKPDQNDPKKRLFNLERLVKEKSVVTARVEAELKRLAAPTRGVRKIIGMIAGGITGFFVGGIRSK